jgi:Zn-finger nucleic acid-binding protein
MNCPTCKSAMIVLELEQVEIDYCCDCSGIWLDAGELELLFEDSNQSGQLVKSFATATSLNENIRRCPICLTKMDKVSAGDENEPIVIDRCAKSHGLWFDRGELSQILSKGSFDKEKKVIKLLTEMFGVK